MTPKFFAGACILAAILGLVIIDKVPAAQFVDLAKLVLITIGVIHISNNAANP